MPNIRQLSLSSNVNAGDLLLLYEATSYEEFKASLTELLNYVQASYSAPASRFVTYVQYVTTSTFTVTTPDTGEWIWLIVKMPAGLANGTLILPESPVDQQEVIIFWENSVTSLGIYEDAQYHEPRGGWEDYGYAIDGMAVRFKYDALDGHWYMINTSLT